MVALVLATLLFSSMVQAPGRVKTSALPNPFVSLTDVAPGVMIDMRYHGAHNFIGRPIQGYNQPVCLLTKQAAEALAAAQREAESAGLSLKVYDCYRPQKAVNDFAAWAKDLSNTKMKKEFYPHVEKSELFKKGYIAEQSGHSRGSTVDITLVPLPAVASEEYKEGKRQTECYRPYGKRFGDNSLDMGSGYDCFDPIAHTSSPNVKGERQQNRLLLKNLLEKHGFVNFELEWWHFTLKHEPYRETYFDFDVETSASVAFQVSRFVNPVSRDYISPPIRLPRPMDRAVLSWNATAPPRSSVSFMLRSRGKKEWSPWLVMGQWGEGEAARSFANQKNSFGSVDIDTLILAEATDEWQYRIAVKPGTSNVYPKVYSVALAFKESKDYQKTSRPQGDNIAPLPVPTISQFVDGISTSNPQLASRICSPTSMSMLIQYLGYKLPPLVDFVEGAYDHQAKTYGNWPINTALLFRALNGYNPTTPNYLTYVRWYESLDELLSHVKQGMPVIVSIQYKAGELAGAPKPTEGHLVLIRGGNADYVFVNDPAAPDRNSVARKYKRDQFLKAWKGVAYVTERLP